MTVADELAQFLQQAMEAARGSQLKLKTLGEEYEGIGRAQKKLEKDIADCKKKLEEIKSSDVMDFKTFSRVTSTLARKMKELEHCKATLEQLESIGEAVQKKLQQEEEAVKYYSKELENWGKLYEFKAK